MNDNAGARHPEPRATGRLMAVVLVANALLFPAITLYLGNSDRFHMPLFSALELVLWASALFILLAFIALGRLSQHTQRSICLLFAALSLLFWVQSSFLVWDYGALDGRGINWRDFRLESLIDIGVWLSLSVALVLIIRTRSQLVIEAAILIFVLQAVSITYRVWDSSPPLVAKPTPHSQDSMQDVLGFSRNSNVLHIVADGFQSDVFEELISDPELRDTYNLGYSGFTFYRETLGMFPYTRFSVPAFLSAKVYSNRVEKDGYIDDALAGKSIISTAKDNGFNVDLIVDGNYWFNRYNNLPYTHIHKISNSPGLVNPRADSAMLFDLALFRITPGAFKVLVYRNQRWLASQVFSIGEQYQFKFFTHTYFLNRLIESMHADTEEPVYKYLHIMNTHNPMVVDGDCSYSGQTAALSRHSLVLQSRCTMDTLAQLFDKMRSLGIYDETTIIIHGDHGGWVGNRRKDSEKLATETRFVAPWIRSLASPLMAIKIPMASGPIATSNLQISLRDLPDTIADIMNWPESFGSTSLFRLKEGDARTRYFRFYDWQENAWEASYTGPITEYAITGSHYEVEWVEHQTFFPSGAR